jgi:uncharacterized protein
MSTSNTPLSAPLVPLGADDFDAQDLALDALREFEDEDEIPTWEFCEGFLAALVCCRRPIEPAEYWPLLLGEGFNPMAHMEFVMRWHRRRAELETALDSPVETLEDERTYQPEVLDTRGAMLAQSVATDEPPQPGDETAPPVDIRDLPGFAQIWALGFMFVVESWPDEWRAPRDPDAARMLDEALEAIVALTEDDDAPPTVSMFADDAPPSVSQRRLDDYAVAIWAVYDLRQLWKSLGPRIQTVRKAPAPGRNDPCPCGSGKKFKKCHGA